MSALRLSAALAASMLFAAHAALPAEPISQPILERAYAQAAGRVVGVTYVLRQMEVETGEEGQRAEGILCGVVAGPRTIVVSADIFPEPGGDPRMMLAPEEFEIHASAERTFKATASGIDRKLNLAYLTLDPADGAELDHVRFREEPALRVGDPVIIAGVLPRKYEFAPAIYTATVNARIEGELPLLGIDTVLGDLAVGGLVLRSDGSPAGIVTKDLISESVDLSEAQGNFISLLANSGQPPFRRPGYAMILPFGAFSASLSSPPPLDLHTEFKRAWLGIVMQALDKDLIDYWGLPVPGGIIIGSVVEGSPARAAGIRQGDIITRFAGEPIRITDNSELGDFRRKVERMEAGSEVAVQIYRDGRPLDTTIRLGDAPRTAALADEYEDEDFGLTVREITIDVLQAMNLEPGQEGVVIDSTEDSGWADVAGLFARDIILAINGVRVLTVEDVRDALADVKLRRDPEAIFFVMRPPDTIFVRVRTEFGGARPPADGQ